MKKMRGYKNVYCVGEEKAKQDHMFYKYMNVERAIQFLKTGEYYFVEPTAWQDPYEKRFYTADYSHFDSFIPGVTYATCLTDKISNEAAWKMYRDEGGGLKNRSVRFDIRRSMMLRYMDGEIRDAKIVFGKANYRYTTSVINKIHKPDSPAQYGKYFSDFSEESFLKLLLIKRKAFEYESEVRMFVVPHPHQPINIDRDSAKYIFKFSKEAMKSMIEQISIDPSCTELETEIIKAKIEEMGYTCSQNPLYKKKDRIVIGEII